MSNVTSEEQVQEDILEYLEGIFHARNQKVVEQSIPNSQTVLRNSQGQIEPYIAIQFGDLQEGRLHNMAGPRGDDYVMPVYTQVIAPSPKIARRIANRLRNAMIGASFGWTGSVRKRPGGGMFPIVTSNGATEAYQMPASFGVLIQYAELTTP